MRSFISRQQFSNAIEAGITQANFLTEEEVNALWEVARNSTISARGTFSAHMNDEVCYCPLGQIGFDFEREDRDPTSFYEPFDALTDDGNFACVLDIQPDQFVIDMLTLPADTLEEIATNIMNMQSALDTAMKTCLDIGSGWVVFDFDEDKT